jgi:hypothetical protein
MIKTNVTQKIQSIFARIDGQPVKRLEGENSWAHFDATRERDRFQSLSDNPEARAGTYQVSNTRHPFAPPYRSEVQLSGDLKNGEVFRQDALFLNLPVRTTGDPTFLTTVNARFDEEGVTKLETVEGPKGVTARRLFADYDEPWKDYVEEYFIAK